AGDDGAHDGLERAADEPATARGQDRHDREQGRVDRPGDPAHHQPGGAVALAVGVDIAPVAVHRAADEAPPGELDDGADIGEQALHRTLDALGLANPTAAGAQSLSARESASRPRRWAGPWHRPRAGRWRTPPRSPSLRG